jgi:hypothetical protein
MKKLWRDFFYRTKGQAMVEFIIVFSLGFIVLVMFVLQFVYISTCMLFAEYATFMGVRAGVVNENRGKIELAVRDAVPDFLIRDLEVQVLSGPQDENLELKILYNVELFFPFANVAIKKARNLSSLQLPLSARYSLPREKFIT